MWSCDTALTPGCAETCCLKYCDASRLHDAVICFAVDDHLNLLGVPGNLLVIQNVPTSDNLNRAALRLYFTAWTSLIAIATDFDEVYPDEGDWTEEKANYLKGCQSDMQSCCTLMQQSNELALKARVAEVSPYLLLFRNDRKLSLKPEILDFSDLRTLDANDLPGAVNSFCSTPLSDAFVADYAEVRKLRNKIIHLGYVDREFEPDALLKIMVRQFIELWSKRGWLAERYNYAKSSRHAVFHDGKYSSAESEVYDHLDDSISRFTKSEFKLLFGVEKHTRRYLCPICYQASNAPNAGMDPASCQTAFLPPGKNLVRCSMCETTVPVIREKCITEDCNGNVLADGEIDIKGMCLTCGEYQDIPCPTSPSTRL